MKDRESYVGYVFRKGHPLMEKLCLSIDDGFDIRKQVTLIPYNEGDIISEEALDPKTWNIPKGYYAIK